MIFPVRSNGNNAPRSEGAAQRFAVVPLVQPQPLGFAFALADADAIEGGEEGTLVMPIGFGQEEVEWMAMSFHYEVAFKADNAVFAGVADLRRSPFFDLITLAS